MERHPAALFVATCHLSNKNGFLIQLWVIVFLFLQDLLVESGKSKLRKWLNMNFRIEMTDGRILIGVFLCTDRDANVILGK